MPKKWSKKIIRLLQNWRQQISINENQHLYRGSKYKFIYRGFSIFDIISKAGILSILITAITNNNVNLPILILITIMESITTATDFITIYFDFGTLSEKHFTSAREYNSLSKLIDSTLALQSSDRDDPKQFITLIMKKFSKIADNSPDLPFNDVVHKLDLQIYNNPKDACGLKNSSSDDSDKTDNTTNLETVKITPIQESLKSSVKFESIMETSEIARPNYLTYQWNRLETATEKE